MSSLCISNDQPSLGQPFSPADRLVYKRAELLALRSYDVTPARSVRKAIFNNHLWLPARLRLQPADSWISQLLSLPSGDRPIEETFVKSAVSLATSSRHTASSSTLIFGCLNIRSLLKKFDDVVELFRDHKLGLLCLTESWHDQESAVIGRLRNAGFNVAERPRPRTATSDLSVNHGGIVVVATADISVSPLASLTGGPTTFELLSVRVVSGHFTGIVVVIYRPGSAAVQQSFFDELTAILDRVATYQEPIFVTGDLNIRLDHQDDHHADQLRLLIESYGLVLHNTDSTHKLGGILDVVITHADTVCQDSVQVVDVGLSDHHLLQWTFNAYREIKPAVTVSSRSWRRLDYDRFESLLSTSRLCQSDAWPTDIDEMAAVYDTELTRLLDQLIPCRQFVRRPRPSDAWFDGACRAAKRQTRRLERAYAAACRRSAANAVSSYDVATEKSSFAVDEVTAAKAAWFAQRCAYRRLRQQKCSAFWSERIENDRDNPQKLWRSVDSLLGRGRVAASSSISVESFNQFFAEKVAKVRASTNSAPPPTYTRIRSDVAFRTFKPLSSSDVVSAINRLPDKCSVADPIPTYVLKRIAHMVAPFIVALFNRSLKSGCFPVSFKQAFITPILKKSGLDSTDLNSYRPISNLSVLSKLLERLVVSQLLEYLTVAELLPPFQSGFRPGHSTETAVLHVLSDLLSAADRGDFAALTLLDLSAAFDTVDHEILLQRLQSSFGINEVALKWFNSFLAGRTQCVRRGSTKSSSVPLICGVPQGSVLAPILFILYVSDLATLIENHGLLSHQYADDTQIYGACSLSDVTGFSSKVSDCMKDIACWMRSNRLQLNPDKTEFMWCATSRRQHQLPSSALMFGSTAVKPVSSVRDLGIFIDSDLVMRTHVCRTVSSCFAALRQLRSIRRLVPVSVFTSLVVALVLCRLDYGNGTLVGLPAYLIRRLQSVQNAAARLVFRLRRSDHVTDALVSLHWLRVPERITYKLAVMTFKALRGMAPHYLSQFVRVADVPSRIRLRSAATDHLIVPAVKLSTVGSRSFRVAGARVWNNLPADITSSSSLSIFKNR